MSKKVFLLLLLLPFICSDGLSQSRVYWTDTWDPEIRSAFVDGSNIATLAGITLPTGMAVDSENGWVYYLSFPLGHGVFGELRRSPLAGGSQEILAETGWTEGGLALDLARGKAYWATRVRDMNHVSIWRSNLDGSSLEEVAQDVSDKCTGIAMDPVGNRVYIIDGKTILRIDPDTGTVDDVGPDPAVAPYPQFSEGISIDAVARKMYWLRRGNGSSSGWMGVFRADLNGSNAEKIWEDTYSSAEEIVVDGANRYVYWAQSSTILQPNGNYIRRARTDVPITWDVIENVVTPPDMPRTLPNGLDLFIDPGPAVLSMPADEAQNVSSTVELRWQEVICSTRYDLQVSSSPDFSSIVYRTNTPKRAAAFVAPVAPNRYWWRVHSNACGIASHWSAPRWFDVGSSGPLVATLLLPEDGIQTGPAVAFSWTPPPDAAHQTFQLSSSSDFAPPLIDVDSLDPGLGSYEATGLVSGECYYWRIAGWDDEGRYTFTTPGMFSVMDLAGGLTLLEPADGADGVSAYPDFSWTEATGADRYRFQLSLTHDFAAFEIDTVVESTSLRLPVPLGYTMGYNWRVCGENLAGSGPWAEASFTVAIGTGTETVSDIPVATRLRGLYPNPTSIVTNLAFDIAETGRVRLTLFDVFGRQLLRVLDRHFAAGRYDQAVEVSSLASGAYLAVLEAGDVREVGILTVVR